MKKQLFKFIFDLVMAILFVLLFPIEVTGLTFHEVSGIIIGVAILIHIALNWKWVVQITKRIFSRKLPTKLRVSALLNFLLLVDAILFVVSGLLISKVVLPGFRYLTHLPWSPIHEITSYIGLVLIGVHIGLHWNWIRNMWRRKGKQPKTSFQQNLIKYTAYLLLVVGTLGLLGSMVKVSVMTGILLFSDSQTFSHHERDRGHGKFERAPQFEKEIERRGRDKDLFMRKPDFDKRERFERERGRDQDGRRGDRERGERRGRSADSNVFSWIGMAIFYLSQFGAAAFYTNLIDRRLIRKRKTAEEKLADEMESTAEAKPTDQAKQDDKKDKQSE